MRYALRMSEKPSGRPRGRPRIPSDKRRDCVVRFRTTRAERDDIKRAAAGRGMDVTAYLWSLVAADNAEGTESA